MDETTITAICSAISAIAILANNYLSARNGVKIQRLHDCLDEHIEAVKTHNEELAANLMAKDKAP